MNPFEQQQLLLGLFANDGTLRVSDEELATTLLRARCGQKRGQPAPEACEAVQQFLMNLYEIRQQNAEEQPALLRTELGKFLGVDFSIIVDGAPVARDLSVTNFNVRSVELEGTGYLDGVRVGRLNLVEPLLVASDTLLRHGRPHMAFAACSELLKVHPALLGTANMAACYEQTIQLAHPAFANVLGAGLVGLLTTMVQKTIIDTPPHHAAVSALVGRIFSPGITSVALPNALLALVTHTAKDSPESNLAPRLFEGLEAIPVVKASFNMRSIREAYEVRTGMRPAPTPVKEKLSTGPN